MEVPRLEVESELQLKKTGFMLIHRFGQLNFLVLFPHFILFIYLFMSLVLFRAAPAAYGTFQARGRIGAIVAGPRCSHSHARSEPHLRPTAQLTATPDP